MLHQRVGLFFCLFGEDFFFCFALFLFVLFCFILFQVSAALLSANTPGRHWGKVPAWGTVIHMGDPHQVPGSCLQLSVAAISK